jgi:hypothetical protein
MDIIRESLTTIVDRFQYETSVEHFVLPDGMKPPTDEQYNSVAPYFKKYDVTPQEAFSVVMFFDKDPASLTKKDVESRVKMLNILLTMLNDPATSDMILQNYKQLLGKDMPNDQQENAKGMLNLLKRLVKLLILEAKGDDEDKSDDEGKGNGFKMMIVCLLVIIAILAYMLYNKK